MFKEFAEVPGMIPAFNILVPLLSKNILENEFLSLKTTTFVLVGEGVKNGLK